MAQIETSNIWAARNSAPADETSPRIVSSSGRPAATRAPNASTRMASVTGQLMSSERIIASRLAVLKSDHIPEAPVRLTVTWSVEALPSGPFRSSAARTISIGSAADPPMTMAVCPSEEIVAPFWGGVTDATRASERRMASAARDRGREEGIGGGEGRRVDDHHQPGARVAREVTLDEVARGDRLRAGILPAGSGESGLDARRQNTQPDDHDGPCDEREPGVGGRPAPQAADGTERAQRAQPRRWVSRRSTSDVGQSPARTNIHWLMPTIAVTRGTRGSRAPRARWSRA